MNAEIRLLPSQDGRTEINLFVPSAMAMTVVEALRAVLSLTGHKIRRVNEEGEEIFSAEEVFPEGNPAMLLRGYRGKHDMTQTELAEKLQITQNRISDMESGKRPINKNTAKKLGEIFNTPYKSFL
jgi:DNA-binding XRE family transcriptional regulator